MSGAPDASPRSRTPSEVVLCRPRTRPTSRAARRKRTLGLDSAIPHRSARTSGRWSSGATFPSSSRTTRRLSISPGQPSVPGSNTLWLFDHLYAPGLPDHPALEAWTAATALLADTAALRVGALVLRNNFRHPVLLGRMATTLDLISGGRDRRGTDTRGPRPGRTARHRQRQRAHHAGHRPHLGM
ncbi:LLM class flavin-dependent oxidoreductase [Nocardia asteroides]